MDVLDSACWHFLKNIKHISTTLWAVDSLSGERLSFLSEQDHDSFSTTRLMYSVNPGS